MRKGLDKYAQSLKKLMPQARPQDCDSKTMLDFLNQLHGYDQYRPCIVDMNSTLEDHQYIESFEKKYLPEELVASSKVTWDWQMKNPEILFIARKIGSNDVLGHMSVIPITNELADDLCSHTIADTEFSAEDIQQYEINKDQTLYIAVVCVQSGNRGLVTERLFKKFYRFARGKINEGCRFQRIVAEACTTEGERLLTSLGFQRLDHGGKLPAMFTATWTEFEISLDKWLKDRMEIRAIKILRDHEIKIAK